MRWKLPTILLGLVAIVGFAISGARAQVSTDLANLRGQLGGEDMVWAYDRVQLPAAWEAIEENFTGTGNVIVGVIDTGIDTTHPEFAGFNFGSFPLSILRDYQTGGHGTKVAGIIGADNKSVTVALPGDSPEMNGVLSGVPNISYQLSVHPGIATIECENGTQCPAPLTTLNYSSRALASSEGAIARDGSQILNWSMGFSRCSTAAPGSTCFPDSDVDDIRQDWEEFIQKHSDVTFVTSAGNTGADATDGIPNGLVEDNLIVVGATDKLDGRAFFSIGSSNFGAGVHISAPGEFVYAPAPEQVGNYPSSAGDYTTLFNGTSSAAPFVTGVAGLLRSIKPELTPKQIRDILIETGDVISTDKPIGPRLNALAAVCHEDVLDCKSTIIIEKTVINNDGGIAALGDFSFLLDGNPVSEGVPIEVSPGTYTLTESPFPGYTALPWAGDCASDGTITVTLDDPSFNDGFTCDIVNDDIAAPALRQLTNTTFGVSLSPAISGNGTTVAFISNADHAGENPTNLTELYTVDSNGNNLTKDTINTPPFQFGRGKAIDINQDGATVALLSGSDPLGTNPENNVEVFVLDNGILRQLTSSTALIRNESISITNDGETITFISTGNYATGNPDLSRELFVVDTSTATFQQLTNNLSGVVDDVRISGDGSTALFTTYDVFGKRSLYAVDTATKTISLIAQNVTSTNTPAFSLNISDDGSRIAFAATFDPLGTNSTNSFQTFTMKTDGTETYQLSSTFSIMVALSGNGTTVAFLEGIGIEAANFDGTNRRTVFENLGAVSPTSLDIVGMTLVFDSQVDPLGTNTDNNSEIFLQTL